MQLIAFAFAILLAQATVTSSGGPVETATPLVATTPNPGASPIDSSMPSLAIPTPPGTTPAPVLTPGPATGAADSGAAWFWRPFWTIVICLAAFLVYNNRRPRSGGTKPPPR